MTRPAVEDAEHRLAALTGWGLFGAVGICLVASGFSADDYLASLAGYTALAAGFVSHLIVNRVYRRGFRGGEIATAIGLYGVAATVFLASWLLDPAFTRTDVASGLTGLALTVAGFLAYLTTRYGLRGSFSMFHIQNR